MEFLQGHYKGTAATSTETVRPRMLSFLEKNNEAA